MPTGREPHGNGARIVVCARERRVLDAALTALAKAEGISKQEVVRRAVLERYAFSSRRDKLDEISQEMLERWGDVLDRLGRS